jgi:hypothetical protein
VKSLAIILASIAGFMIAGCCTFSAEAGAKAIPKGVLPALPDQTMDGSYMRVKMDLAKRIQSDALVRNSTSVNDWRFGLDIGDGDFGAAIYGYPNAMCFDIGKNDITIYDYALEPAFPLMSFEECRKHLVAGDVGAVTKALAAAATKSGIHGGRPGESWGGRLAFDFLAQKTITDYREQLDFWSGTATSFFKVDGREATVQSFASHDAEVMVIRVSSVSEAAACALMRNPLSDKSKPFLPTFSFVDGMAFLHMTMPSGSVEHPDQYVIALVCDGGDLSPVAEAPSKSLTAPKNWLSAAYACKAAEKGKPLTFFVTVVTTRDVGGPRADPKIKEQDIMAVVDARLKSAIAKGYDALRGEHLAWWRNYWQRSWIAMNEKAGEYPFYFSLYKAGSARRPGKIPPGYYAPWRGADDLGWGRLCFNFEQINYNFGNMVSNHGELQEPILGTLWHTKDLIAARTKSFYKMDGLCYPHCISNRGNIQHYQNTCMNVGTSGEAVSLFWQYFEFTQDKEFLRQAAYPMLRAAAEFFRQYLQTDENGQLYIFPSYFSEYPAFFKNSITDQVNFRMTFAHAAEAAAILGVDAGKAKLWRDCLRRMQPLAVDKKGVWLTADPLNPAKQKMPSKDSLNLYPILPGDMVNKWHGSEELRRQAEASCRHWLGRHPEVWDKGFCYMDAARMGDRDYYPAMLKAVCVNAVAYGAITSGGERNKLKTGKWPISVNWDDCGGTVAAGTLSEFLLNSQFGEIRVFPAMPLKGHYAFHSLRARGAFLVSSEFRDGTISYILIKSLTGNPCKVIQPFDEGTHVVVRDLGTGSIVATIPHAKIEQGVEFKTDNDHMYVVERRDIPLEKVPVLDLNSSSSPVAP